MKCDIVGKGDNYKYPVALYTHHFSEQFTFSVFFFLQVCFWAIYDKKLKFAFILATSCEYDNRGSQRKISNFRYVAKLFYLKIRKSTNSA